MKKSENFVTETARLIGDVTIGKKSTIWFGAVVRADINSITIGDESNIQDNSVLHVDYDAPLVIGNRVTVGHAVILHGCTINDECLIGMGACILDKAVIGKHCIIGARALITKNTVIPDNSLVIGSPGRVVRQVTAEEIERIIWSAEHYVKMIVKLHGQTVT